MSFSAGAFLHAPCPWVPALASLGRDDDRVLFLLDDGTDDLPRAGGPAFARARSSVERARRNTGLLRQPCSPPSSQISRMMGIGIPISHSSSPRPMGSTFRCFPALATVKADGSSTLAEPFTFCVRSPVSAKPRWNQTIGKCLMSVSGGYPAHLADPGICSCPGRARFPAGAYSPTRGPWSPPTRKSHASSASALASSSPSCSR